MTVRFEESSGDVDPKWGPVAEALRSRRGEWATPDFPASSPGAVATAICRGKYRAFRPAGAFEAKQLHGKLWIRYVGAAA